jgi:hypothetical protein
MTRLIVDIAVGTLVAAGGAYATRNLLSPGPAGNATLYAYSAS